MKQGTKLRHYEIVGRLGAGGMGEVYRATDTRLRRDVAIKVLPADVANDPERLARLEREAQVLATLDHPNIAAIHGLEEAQAVEPGATADQASSTSLQFLVMELVQGAPLSRRIEAGPIQLEEALPLALGIARGLAAAHDRGIVHRDVKPDNVHVSGTSAGSWGGAERIKVLDFGLAKPDAHDNAATDITHSPTAMAPTATGVILGTAPYMSPEQARGLPVDRRTDVWAFGCVLFEMLAGRRAFAEATVSDTIASILRAEPDWSALPEGTPPAIQRLLRRCLTKDPEKRLRDLGDAALDLEDALDFEPSTEGRAPSPDSVQRREPPPTGSTQRVVPWLITVVAIAVAVFAATRKPGNAGPTHGSAMHLDLALPIEAPVQLGLHPAVALSPDGRYLAHVGRGASGGKIFVHDLGTGAVEAVPETESASNLSFSPDGAWLAFVSRDGWKKLSIASKSIVPLGESGTSGRGATWLGDAALLLGGRRGISRLDASGGAAELLTHIDRDAAELSHYWPFVLPGNRAVLYVAGVQGSTSYDAARIAVYDLENDTHRTLIEGGTAPSYVDSGHLVFARGGKLYAVPFDLDQLAVTGTESAVVDDLMMRNDSGGAHYTISAAGALAYVRGGSWELSTTVERRARDGTQVKMPPIPEALYGALECSPDSRYIALNRFGPNDDLWVADLRRETLTRVTFGEGGAGTAVWSSDGSRLVYNLDHVSHAVNNLYVMDADGGNSRRILPGEYHQFSTSWVRSTLAFMERRPETGFDIRTVEFETTTDPDATLQPEDFLVTEFHEMWPVLSPDGRLMAYVSNESGENELYLRPFRAPGGKVRVSTAGGSAARWSPDGRELFWVQDDKLMAVRVQTTPILTVSRPEFLFATPPLSVQTGQRFDVDPTDGTFLFLRDAHQPDMGRVVLVLDWVQSL